MVRRRLIFAIVAGALLLSTTAGTALAGEPQSTSDDLPPSTTEQPVSDRKAAAAELYAAGIQKLGGLGNLSCIGPLTSTDTTAAKSAAALSVPAGCTPPPGGFLTVEARDQIVGFYCGPAVGQVIANYSWAAAPGQNAFTQQKLAAWMQTDRFGSTDAWRLEAGLEAGTRGSPRRPALWDWVVIELADTDRDGSTADQLQAYAQSNISQSRMPLALSLKPHDARSNFNLPSWPRAVQSIGHWISIYGWLGFFTGNDDARIYYTDSSRDEGGATGKFWIPTRHIAAMVAEHTRRIVW